MPVKFLVPREEYLAAGIHIGMKERTKQMRPFVYKVRPDGLAVMNLQTIDERIRTAAKFLARAQRILVVSRKGVAHGTIDKFAEIVGAKSVTGRFMPGMLTNPHYEHFYEADMVLIVDPMSDHQALKESATARIPVVAICDTFNETDNVDLIIPANNKGIRSITLLFWLLAREILKERGGIKSNKDFKYKIEDFVKRGAFRQERRERERERGQTGRESARNRRDPARPRTRKR
jgi:small subunit ribosomal protein S2